jgi:hypothetical protein
MRNGARIAAAGGCLAVLAACWTVSDAWRAGGSDDGGSPDATTDGGPEGGPPDGSPKDVVIEVAPADANFVYNDISDPSFWQLFDLTTINPAATGYVGAVFDGRYVYYVPYGAGSAGLVVRYDVAGAGAQDPFALAQAYAAWDISTVSPNAKGFAGAVFDGRYVYFVPIGAGSGSGVLARYDTTKPFGATASLEVVDLTAVVSDKRAAGFVGAVFDQDAGTIYFVPNLQGAFLVRYHTALPLDAAASYETYPETTGASAFWGGVFDGRYVYYSPASGANNKMLRYDTTGSLSSPGSYAIFDPSTIVGAASGYLGILFDGRYVTLVPNRPSALSAQYDTRAGDFLDAASYSLFNVASLDGSPAQFAGGAFDGTRIVFAPGTGGIVEGHGAQSVFDAASSWGGMDLTKLASPLASHAVGFSGATFDGRYIYLVPQKNGVIARFDARTPRGPWGPGSP